MPERSSYEAATIRVVPRVEREEFINVGVVLFCAARQFLDAHIDFDLARLEALAPGLMDATEVQAHLAHLQHVCAGGDAAGALAALSQAARFHWLVAPRSTVIQTSPVHSGFCEDPRATLEQLVEKMVRVPKGDTAHS
ncbi:MAG: DUF3037 domain-containing protein [Chloroflexi bacterium]|nr:DUF3037 domain-containing protein [Chloroflexota bacterium]